MSNYFTGAKNPKTGEFETVLMRDDYFDKHKYGVMFEDGSVYKEKDIEFFKVEFKSNDIERYLKD